MIEISVQSLLDAAYEKVKAAQTNLQEAIDLIKIMQNQIAPVEKKIIGGLNYLKYAQKHLEESFPEVDIDREPTEKSEITKCHIAKKNFDAQL